jgi:hypothetical protein
MSQSLAVGEKRVDMSHAGIDVLRNASLRRIHLQREKHMLIRLATFNGYVYITVLP